MKNRIICMALVFAALFGFSSCKKDAVEEIPPKKQSLAVEIETVEYDDASIEEASARIADITAGVLLKYYGKQQKNVQRLSSPVCQPLKSAIISFPNGSKKICRHYSNQRLSAS